MKYRIVELNCPNPYLWIFMLFDANFSHLKTEMNHQGSKSLRCCCLKIHTGFGEHQTSINNSRGRRRGQKAFTK